MKEFINLLYDISMTVNLCDTCRATSYCSKDSSQILFYSV